MKTFTKHLLLSFAFLLITQIIWGQFWTENFTSGSYTVTLGGEGNDGTSDYFQTTDGSNIGITYTGNSGNFFAAQDIDDGGWTGSASPSQLTWTGINISGYTGLSFSGLFASSATNTIDAVDSVLVQYQIDGGGWNNLLAFRNDGTTYNTEFGEDTDFDGNSDGSDLTATFANFTKNISGTGSSLDLRITVAVNAGGEDFAFETFQLFGTGSNDNDSQVSASSTLTEPATISSLQTSANGVQVFDFTFTDLGTADGLATIIDQLQINQGSNNGVADWTNAIAGAVLNGPDVSNLAGTVNATDITFSGSGFISVGDNTNETYTLSIWLKTDLSAVSDNDILEFAVDYNNITTDVSGSSFGSGAPESGDTNVAINIDATELRFVQQPTTANINDCMSPDVSVEATDVNGNRDTDFTESIRITSTGSLVAAPIDLAAVSGIATFSGTDCITHDATGTNLTLNAERTTTLDWDITSNQFDITDINACGLEEFSGGTTAPAGWTFTGITGTYTTSGNFGNSSPSLKVDDSGDIIETAIVTSPSDLSFWIKGQGTDATSALLVEGWDGSWNTIENIVPLPTTGTTKTYNTGLSSYTKFRFTYTKSAGNLAFDDVDVTCGNCAEPTNDATALTFPSKTSTSIDLSWINGNGGNRIVVCREGAAVSFTPADNNTYAANADYSAATEVGPVGEGNKVVYNSSASTLTVTGLIPGTQYYFKIYEYGCSGGAEDYLTSGTPAEGDETTLPEDVGNFTMSCITNTTVTLTWTIPVGGFDGILITVREGTTAPVDPTCDGQWLTSASTVYTSATTYCGTTTDSRYVYNSAGTSVTITDLTPGADYIFKAFTYNGSDWTSGTQHSGNASVSDVSGESSFVSNTQMRVTWSNPSTCYDEIMVVGKDNTSYGAITTIPTGDGTLYTANSVFGTGGSDGNLPANEYCVYKETNTFIDVTNLTNGNNYCFKIFVRKGNDWSSGITVCNTPADITVFEPGDLVYVGYDTKAGKGSGCSISTARDVFYILTMVDIKPGTSFGLLNASYEYGAAANERTDKFWGCTSTPGTNAPGRIDVQWNGASNITAGSILELFLSPTAALDSAAVNGVDQKANFASTGSYCNIAENDPDQMWIYQGTITDFGTTPNIYSEINGNILFGLSNQAAWVPFSVAVSTVRTSRIHPDIECFNMDFSGDVPVNYYLTSAPHSGSKRTLLGTIMSSGNWTTATNTTCNDVPSGVATATFTVTAGYTAGTWRGDADADWYNCSNWEALAVPDETTDVTISGVTTVTNFPDIDHTAPDAGKFDFNAKCKNLTIDNDTLTISGSSLDTLLIYGNLTLQNSGILDMNFGGTNDGIVYVSGNWNNQATFNAGKGTVVFNGSNAQTLTTSAANETFNNLRLTNNNLAGLTLNKPIIINDTLSQIDNLLNLNGNSINLNGVYENTNSFFEGNTTSDFIVSADADNGSIDSIYFKNNFNVNNFSIDRTGQNVLIMTDLTVNNNLTVSAGNITMTPAHNYTVSGTLTNTPGTADALVLQSDASGTASLIQTTGAVPATVERYLSGNNWHYIFAPLTQIDTATYTVAPWGDINPNIYWYNEPTADFWSGYTIYNPTGWQPTNAEASSYLQTDRGYINYFTADKTYSQTGGNLTDVDKSFTLSYTVNGTGNEPNTGTAWTNFDGWNLFGNPYVSAVDWDNAGLDKTYIENFIYYYDNTQDKYLCYGGNPPWDNNGVSINGGTQYIPAGQGFFVKALSNGNSQSFVIPKTARTHNGQPFYKSSASFENLIKLQIKKDFYTDETIIRTFPETTGVTDDHDLNYDAYKMFSLNTERPQLYSHTVDNSQMFAVNTLPEIIDSKIISLGISVNESGTYSIDMTENSFDNMHIWLEDKAENFNTDLLTKNSYSFNEAAETNDNRFYLHIDKNTIPKLNLSVPDQIIPVNNYYEYDLPDNLFSDNDFGDKLTITVTSEDGNPLPDWLTFDEKMMQIKGTPTDVQTVNIKVVAKDIFNAEVSDVYKLSVKNSSSVTDLTPGTVSIYPNPANNKLHISVLNYSQKGEIVIYDITGKKMLNSELVSSTQTVDISSLTKGIYIVEIKFIKGVFKQRIVKE
ncbi:MAG: T9SS type A sorting domain-containing protein [Chlorobi bacterium]|nr:T9SS type A sorting domain-containing protein [Chlorobiota bacterium]